MEFLEYSGSYEEFQRDMINFGDEFQQEYINAMTSGRYKQVDRMVKLLKGVEKAEKDAFKQQPEAVERLLREQVKKAGFKPQAARTREFRQEQRIILSQMDDMLTEILEEANVKNPNIIVNQILQHIAAGRSFKTLNSELKKSIEQMEKVLPTITALLNMVTQVGGMQTAKGKARKSKPSEQIANSMGVFNEFIVGDVITNMVQNGIDVTMNQMSKKLTMKEVSFDRVGAVDVGDDVSDTKITLVNKKNKTFSFGVDVKFHVRSNGKNPREYNRGPLNKEASEVLEFASPKDIAAMMYLMTNSYFLGDKADGDWYNRYLGGHDGEIFRLYNIVLGLYGLLPPDAVFRTAALRNVEELVRNDSRMFVTIDDQMYLMTYFLKSLKKQVLDAGNMGKPIRSLRANFEDIMQKIKAEAGGQIKKSNPAKGLYKQKMDLKMEYLGRGQKVSYADLKAQITDQITGIKLYNWNYKIEAFSYQL